MVGRTHKIMSNVVEKAAGVLHSMRVRKWLPNNENRWILLYTVAAILVSVTVCIGYITLHALGVI